jgi:putative ABC transport system substrate-binding protein
MNASTPAEVESGIAEMSRLRADAVIVLTDTFFIVQRRQIVQLATQHRLPTMFQYQEDVTAGGLMSYGQDLAYNYRRAATYADMILKGAKPGELPIERPARFYLAINLKTAKALGVTVPQSLLARADEVIE